MKYLAITASLFGLAACGGAELSSADLCGQMIEGDTEIIEDMARDGVTPASMCDCVAATIDTLPEAEQATHLAVFKAVSSIRQGAGVGVEFAAEALEEQLRGGTGGHSFSKDDFDKTGQLLNEVGNQLEDGTCKAG